jgi:hypothetical protein
MIFCSNDQFSSFMVLLYCISRPHGRLLHPSLRGVAYSYSLLSFLFNRFDGRHCRVVASSSSLLLLMMMLLLLLMMKKMTMIPSSRLLLLLLLLLMTTMTMMIMTAADAIESLLNKN